VSDKKQHPEHVEVISSREITEILKGGQTVVNPPGLKK
jgi:hypothetical protein